MGDCMEILSIGEKIKRSRIYREVTLKELCADKLSMSKLSCIENNKVEPTSEILEYIADKLDIDYKYLSKDIRAQIEDNISEIRNDKRSSEKQIEDMLITNLEYARGYNYVDLSSDLIHMLFSHYMLNGKLDSIQEILPEYYELYELNTDIEQTYYQDMAKYFFLENEFLESLTYITKIKKYAEENNGDVNLIGRLQVYESMCFSNLNMDDKAIESISKMINYIDKVTDKVIKGFLYSEYFYLNATIKNTIDCELLEKVEAEFKDEKKAVSYLHKRLAEAYLKNGDIQSCVKYSKLAIENKEKEASYEYNQFVTRIIELLLSCEALDSAEEVLSILSDDSINSGNVKMIERVYYLKGEIAKHRGEKRQWELYKNLSLDALNKFGTPKQRYTRYIEMAEMNNQLGNIEEAVKFMMMTQDISTRI